LLVALRYEKQWLQEKYANYQWDVIVSDNRLGFHHPRAHNIYITHQLHLQTGLGKLLNRLASFFHQSYIKKFNELWIPDLEGSQNLAGKLAHPKISFLPTKYLGLISRLHPAKATPYKYDLLFLLSGPEPQRTIFENIILQQIQPKHGRILLIRGTHDSNIMSDIKSTVTIVHLANSQELNQYMLQSKYVICRSGYTSLMDLLRLHKKALLVPTPGQGEQEYLAAHAEQQSFFPSLSQNEFDIDQAIEKLDSFSYSFPFNESDFHQYDSIINNF